MPLFNLTQNSPSCYGAIEVIRRYATDEHLAHLIAKYLVVSGTVQESVKRYVVIPSVSEILSSHAAIRRCLRLLDAPETEVGR